MQILGGTCNRQNKTYGSGKSMEKNQSRGKRGEMLEEAQADQSLPPKGSPK